MRSLDLNILLWFNHLSGHSHSFDRAVALFTGGSPALFGALFAYYFIRPGAQAGQMRRTVLLSGLSGVAAISLTLLAGLVIYRARPFVSLPPGQLRLLIPHAADSSFPSDHTMGSAAFAAGMWRAPERSARWVFLIVALLVSASRLVAGVHWPSDVLGSLLLGGLVAWGVFALEGLLTPVLDWVLKIYGRVVRVAQ